MPNKDDNNNNISNPDLYEKQFQDSMLKLDSHLKNWTNKGKKKNVLHYTHWLKNQLINAPIINLFASWERKNVLKMIKSWKVDESLLKVNEEVLDWAQKQLISLKKSLEKKIGAYKKIKEEIEKDVRHWAALSQIELDRLSSDYLAAQSKNLDTKWLVINKWERIRNEKLYGLEAKRKEVVKKMIEVQKMETEAQKSVSQWVVHTQIELSLLDKRLADIGLLLDTKSSPKKKFYKWQRLAEEARVEEEAKKIWN